MLLSKAYKLYALDDRGGGDSAKNPNFSNKRIIIILLP